jgi:cellulose synthase/poly-beta-1,6-N-acetylglucosamine synthase-like glycosyltransferase
MLVLEIIYLLNGILLAAYGLNSLILTWLGHRWDAPGGPARSDGNISPANFPRVTVQLPVYNERYVVGRLIDSVLQLTWPSDRLQIQILDDSTDETQHIIAQLVKRYQLGEGAVDIRHIRRPNREHFKAGALQAGLALASGEFIAIFDADFLPNPDFLLRTIPYFKDSKVGCVQTRWGHINCDSSRLTQAEALGIDGHFMIEQSARHWSGAFINFNGTAGVWRRTCIADAGGWHGDTLTEDLDLSYRAQINGWRLTYLRDVVVPSELPVQIDAFKRQQFRWAKGSIQTAKKLLSSLWNTTQPLWLKMLGTLHLTNYAVHPLMLLNLLLTLPIALSNSHLLNIMPLFLVSTIGPPLLYWTTMRGKGLPVMSRLGRLGLLVALGTGLSLSNSKAVAEALFHVESDFKRTPKFAVVDRSPKWQGSAYVLPRHPVVWVELLLALYALGLVGWALVSGVWWLVPWMLLYTSGFGYVAGLTFIQAWQTHGTRRSGSVGHKTI